MIDVKAVTLEFNGVRLEPLSLAHAEGLRGAAADGELWNIRVTSVPEPHNVESYIRDALEMPNRVAFAVIDASSGAVIGTTSYYDILPAVGRVEVGWTWYAKPAQPCEHELQAAAVVACLRHARLRGGRPAHR
jgi:RimJ/RimL family protein N-acetyltransferase